MKIIHDIIKKKIAKNTDNFSVKLPYCGFLSARQLQINYSSYASLLIPISVTIFVLINVYTYYSPFFYLNIFKITNRKINKIKDPRNNNVIMDQVPKLLKTLSLSQPKIYIYLGKREIVEIYSSPSTNFISKESNISIKGSN